VDLEETEVFTTEFELDEVLITVLDDSGTWPDVLVYLYDDLVYIKQWDDEIENYKEVAMSPEMFAELMQAMKLPEGSYIMRTKS
jgi:hypothetical protein